VRNFARRDGEGQERVEAEDKEVDEDNDEGDEEKSVTISPLPPPLLLSSFFAAAACLMCVSASPVADVGRMVPSTESLVVRSSRKR
jgi:hypothetical protein